MILFDEKLTIFKDLCKDTDFRQDILRGENYLFEKAIKGPKNDADKFGEYKYYSCRDKLRVLTLLCESGFPLWNVKRGEVVFPWVKKCVNKYSGTEYYFYEVGASLEGNAKILSRLYLNKPSQNTLSEESKKVIRAYEKSLKLSVKQGVDKMVYGYVRENEPRAVYLSFLVLSFLVTRWNVKSILDGK